ncbi:unnamed protein product [Ceutorhynchus assimilis]|uniref:MPN domain-containing protein n=1 Tax=Ceutorhynchus assimilis TaxID=467358 RepID=A0A9N9MLN1_9CUCU|nr:unnamed protein product [Ceutorhynchus assimilis]
MVSADEKYLKKVSLASDVHAICIQHALTTEKQEIMGLLIGDVDEVRSEAHITACMILHRSDKQPDRVEISPEQLCEATVHAENLAATLGRPMRVIGWYHSHPHITVWPSHVDIRTQATYQMMDKFFVGLIFSVFQSDPRTRNNQIQLTCFQAQTLENGEYERRDVPLLVVPSPLQNHNLESITSLPKILNQEEIETHSANDNETSSDLLDILHNDAIKTLALGHIVTKVSRPMLEDLTARLEATKLRIKELERIKNNLLANKKQ